MNGNNIDDFRGLMNKVQTLWGISIEPDDWFQALEDLDLADIRQALNAHWKNPATRKYPPRPVDILGACLDSKTKALNWPGEEEAWAIAVQAMDEDSTVLWCQEIASAWGSAKPIYDAGDQVGARMAFKEVYSRISHIAVTAGRSPKWFGSLGHDADGRAPALEHAARLRQLPEIAKLASLYSPSPMDAAVLTTIRRSLQCTRMDGPRIDAILEIIAGLPSDPGARTRAIEELAPSIARRVKHELGEIEKGRQMQLVKERLETNEAS